MSLRPNIGTVREFLVLINPTDRSIKAMGHERRINMHPYKCTDTGSFNPNGCIQLLPAGTAELMWKNDNQGPGKGSRLVLFQEDRGDNLYERIQEHLKDGQDEMTAFRSAYKEYAGTDAPTIGELITEAERTEQIERRLIELNITRRDNWSLGWCEKVIDNPELQFEDPKEYALDVNARRADIEIAAQAASVAQQEQQQDETEDERTSAVAKAARKAKSAGVVN